MLSVVLQYGLMCLRCLYVPKSKKPETADSITLFPYNMLKFVESYGFIKQGSGPKCQDTFTIMPNFAQNMHFFAVYDGAGPQGHDVANRAETTMREHIEKSYKRLLTLKKDEEYTKFLQESFKIIQNDLEAAKLDYAHSKSGACCSCMLISGNMVYLANVGNCRTVLGTTKTDGARVSVDVSYDHTLENQRERERLNRASAKIGRGPPSSKDKILGPERIWYSDEGPGVTVTRMLGTNKFGIIPEPEISAFEIKGGDKFLVLGSDGLWDVLESKEVVDFVGSAQEKKNVSEDLVTRARKLWEGDYGAADFKFVGDNVKQKSPDDIAVVIVYLNYFK